MADEDQVITQAEAARLLGVSRQRMEQLVDEGVLPAAEIQMTVRGVHLGDVERYRRERRGPGRPRKQPEQPAEPEQPV